QMPSFWDLLPAGLWPVQPFVWPQDAMQPPPRLPETVRSQAPAPAAFGWAPGAPTRTPAFGWAAAPPAPATALAYAGAIDPDVLVGALSDVESPDPGRAAQARDAQRAHTFASWWFGPQSSLGAGFLDGPPGDETAPRRNAAPSSTDGRGAFAD